MNPKELREHLGKLAAQIRALAEKIGKESRAFTAEEQAEWDTINAEYDGSKRRLELIERASAVDSEMRSMRPADAEVGREPVTGTTGRTGDPHDAEHRAAGGPPSEEQRSRAVRAWCRAQMGAELEEADQQACQAVRISPHQRALNFSLLNSRAFSHLQERMAGVHPSNMRSALSTFEIENGGAIIPVEALRQLEIAQLQFGGILQVAEVFRTETGGELPWPSVNDTGNKGSRVGESKTVASTKRPTFGKTTLRAYKYSSDEILVPFELLEDAAYDLSSILMSMLGERLGRIINEECTLGTGAGMPSGIVPSATVGKTAALTTAVTFEEVIELIHSVDAAYRVGAGFMLPDTALCKLRMIKDGNGVFAWQPGIQLGQPDRLFGYPYTINNDMADMAASTRSILFGNLRSYKVREVRGVRLYRLQERYRDVDQDAFLAFVRRDGALVDAGTHPVKALKMAAA